MKITANGQSFDIPPGSRLPDFLDSINQKPGMVVIERNKQALSPSEALKVELQEGDSLEIVRIVAGG